MTGEDLQHPDIARLGLLEPPLLMEGHRGGERFLGVGLRRVLLLSGHLLYRAPFIYRRPGLPDPPTCRQAGVSRILNRLVEICLLAHSGDDLPPFLGIGAGVLELVQSLAAP